MPKAFLGNFSVAPPGKHANTGGNPKVALAIQRVVTEFGSSRDRDRGIEFRISQGNIKVEEGEKYVL